MIQLDWIFWLIFGDEADGKSEISLLFKLHYCLYLFNINFCINFWYINRKKVIFIRDGRLKITSTSISSTDEQPKPINWPNWSGLCISSSFGVVDDKNIEEAPKSSVKSEGKKHFRSGSQHSMTKTSKSKTRAPAWSLEHDHWIESKLRSSENCVPCRQCHE